MRRWLLFILISVLLPTTVNGKSVSTVKSGYWFNPEIWSIGEVPKGYDTIFVNHTVGSDSTIVIYKTVLEVGYNGEVYSPERIYIDRGAIIINRGSIYTEKMEVFGRMESLGQLTTGSTQIAGSFIIKGSWNTQSGSAEGWQEKIDPVKIYSCKSFPNPSNGTFKITFNQAIEEGELNIHDMKGNNVYTYSIFNEEYHAIQLDVKPGVYFLNVRIGKEFLTQKIIVN